MQAMIKFGADIGVIVPAEGFQHFSDEGLGIVIVEAAFSFRLFDERDSASGEDVALGENFLRFGAQLFIGDEVKAQKRGEDAERVVF